MPVSGFFATAGTIALWLIIAGAVVALALLVAMAFKFRQVHRAGVPTQTRVAFWLPIVYAICPFDILPDPIYIDDIAVLIGGLVYVTTTLRKHAGNRRIAQQP
jgi:uncharacterized membrane protein YkvA (DUF1232 family)